MDWKSIRFLQEDHEENQLSDEKINTVSSHEQMGVEDSCGDLFINFSEKLLRKGVPFTQELIDTELKINRSKHIEFLTRGLRYLPSSYSGLQASRPWLCYWILHSLDLLNFSVSERMATDIIDFLGKCQSPSGGFAGSPDQEPHLAPTYAAVNALLILRSEEAYRLVKRDTLQRFLCRMHQPDGSFILHEGGEVDIRGAYLAASVARVTNILTEDMFNLTPEWLVSCQTYEGGFGGAPGLETHGAYGFCGLAALMLLGHEKLLDTESFLRWNINRQMPYEGGFQGRPNKLVDGCYSFWVGAVFPLLHKLLTKQGDKALLPNSFIFHPGALQEYLLICSQLEKGGFVDKPGKSREYYHTCYCLSGLSVAQSSAGESYSVLGGSTNKLNEVHPLLNIVVSAATKAFEYFGSADPPGAYTSTKGQRDSA